VNFCRHLRLPWCGGRPHDGGLIRCRVSRVANFPAVFTEIRSTDCSIDWTRAKFTVGRTPHLRVCEWRWLDARKINFSHARFNCCLQLTGPLPAAFTSALCRWGADCGRRAACTGGRPLSPDVPQQYRSQKSAPRSRRRFCSSPPASAVRNRAARRSVPVS